MKLEECLGAYREGKTIISCEGYVFHNLNTGGCEPLSSACERELLGEWTIKEEPKPKVKMWPALCCFNEGHYWNITGRLFASEKEAHAYCKTYKKVIWPAIPGADGSYEVE